MKKTVKSIVLISMIICGILFVVCAILAPILAHFKFYQTSAMITNMLSFTCHQGQKGSFWILDYPVALCARCLGFYTGLAIFGIKSLFNKIKLNIKTFGILILISIIGLICDSILKTNIGNIVRFIIGLILGLIFVIIINMIFNLFQKRKIK